MTPSDSSDPSAGEVPAKTSFVAQDPALNDGVARPQAPRAAAEVPERTR